MRLIILGPPGSGKGTQSKLLAKKFHLKHISAGDLLRTEIKNNTKDGKAVEKYVNSGRMAPDKTVIKILLNAIPQDNFIFDGFPRNRGQLKYLKHLAIDKVIFLKTPEKIVILRLKKRKFLENRKDDESKAIKTRLKIFHKEMPHILRFYKDKLIMIDGNNSIKHVFNKILKKLSSS
jgi:adenylate kinase